MHMNEVASPQPENPKKIYQSLDNGNPPSPKPDKLNPHLDTITF